MLLKIKQVKGYEDLPVPKYMTKGSAGIDLLAALERSEVILPGQYKLISTGICIELPEGYEAQVRPRSGLAAKYGITLLNSPGTIDWDYRGEIKVIIINHGKNEFVINRGDRIAQLVIAKVEIPEIVLVEEVCPTIRGAKGFGSTGI